MSIRGDHEDAMIGHQMAASSARQDLGAAAAHKRAAQHHLNAIKHIDNGNHAAANKSLVAAKSAAVQAKRTGNKHSKNAHDDTHAVRFSEEVTQMNLQDFYASYISKQMKNYVSEELIHGGNYQGSSIHLNRSKTDDDRNGNSHYAIKHKDGSIKHFSVSDSKAGEDNGHEHIASKAGLTSNHPFVKAIHKSHTGEQGPKAWQE